MNLKYKINFSSKEDIENHLNSCNYDFVPNLSSYVNISDYADKLYKKAYRIEAWDSDKLIGLVAGYLNDFCNKKAYISNVSVERKYQGLGIANNLLASFIHLAYEKKFKMIELEVESENISAINLYKKNNFILDKKIGSKNIMTHRLYENKDVIVSICCVTYNHKSYIAQAIEGFLMQKTTFPFEILIHDDASTDGTADIIREYEKRYPDLIFSIYQTENQYSKGISISATYQFPRARGKYIALCEGDDYWTDPYKLQKQVDFMEGNPDCSLCFHAWKIIRNNNPNDFSIHRPQNIPSNNKFEMKHAILGGGGFMATNSMVFHKEHILKRPGWMDESPVGDIPLMLLLASKGKIGYIDDVMSVYRIMSSSTSWSAGMHNNARRKKHHYEILKMWTDFDNWTDKKYHRFVVQKKMKNWWNYFKGHVKRIIKK